MTQSSPVVNQRREKPGAKESLRRALLHHLYYTCVKDECDATDHDMYWAIARTARDRMLHRWFQSQRELAQKDAKSVYYFSAEFLLGRALAENLRSLNLLEPTREIFRERGIDLDAVLSEEPDPGLGNGGLGRLAACFLDSMATLGIPNIGYGIRYEFGIFEQHIVDGAQVERRDPWLQAGNPWEIPRHDRSHTVHFYGRVEETALEGGGVKTNWVDTLPVVGVPYDLPIAGAECHTVGTLRLWSCRTSREFNLQLFNSGDYRRAVEEKVMSETVTKVLYPNDQSPEGKELRLKQQYFFVCCSVHDVIQQHLQNGRSIQSLPEYAAIQLNDTHPAIAIVELMRVLLDEYQLAWEKAWDITQRTTAYTNHTLLPEALEIWPASMFGRLLPRHLSLIYEINRRLIEEVRTSHPGNDAMVANVSIFQEGREKSLRMAHLAVVGSHSVNGVAKLHSELIKKNLFPEFAELWPDKFNNKTNGVTPRRWLLGANPELVALISQHLGASWIGELKQLRQLTSLVSDASFLDALFDVKQTKKAALCRHIEQHQGIHLDPESLFVVQVKRMHEYKRQLLNCLHIISLYQEIKADPFGAHPARTFIFAGKAAPGYETAKQHIKLINDVANIINRDPDVQERLKVVFIPNYSVSLAEVIIPAADVSIQISLAGMEASGTGNMKFTMNGALTMGTLDGANIEIREEVGEDHFFLFGLDATEVANLRTEGYRPWEIIEENASLRGAIELLEAGHFSPEEPGRFKAICNDLRGADHYLVCADFDAYATCHASVVKAYQDREEWMRHVVHNIANIEHFSSDRTIQAYADEIWNVRSANSKPLNEG